MEIRAVRRVKMCSSKNCNRVAHFTVFSKGTPNNFFKFCCKKCVTMYETIQKGMR